MPIRVYDYRNDVANVVVFPEIRARFTRMEPAPAGALHSHDVAGEIFLVLEGQCEFVFEDPADNVTCGPGQLIYVEPRVKHTLHAVGDRPSTVYLSVTPHVEPTHTRWSRTLEEQPPQYGTWRGKAPDPHAATGTPELARTYAAAARKLADQAQLHAAAMERHAQELAADAGGEGGAKPVMDEAWRTLRDVLWQLRETELAWNALAPRGMPPSPTK